MPRARLVARRLQPELLALAGSLLIPLVYLLLRELGSGRRTATLGALLLLLVDNALLVESRFMLPDVILLFFGMLAVLAYAFARRATGARDMARRRSGGGGIRGEHQVDRALGAWIDRARMGTRVLSKSTW